MSQQILHSYPPIKHQSLHIAHSIISQAYNPNPIQMQPSLERQQRQYFKNKVSDIISSYERQKQQEEKQKANIKKQIMMSILNNRKTSSEPQPQKSETTKSPKTNHSEQPLEPTFNNSHISIKPNINTIHPDAHFGSEENKQTKHLEQITFNAKKRNQSLEEELTFKESYLNLLRERRQRQERDDERQQEGEEREEELNPSQRYGSNNYHPVQRSQLKSSQSSSENEKAHFDEEKPSKNSILQKYSQMKESLAKQISQHSEEEQQNSEKRFEYEDEQPHEEQEQNLRQRERAQVEERQRQRQKQEKQRQQKGVFLTMEQSQSMVAQDGPKNYAFQIKLDKLTNPSQLEQLKQQRIRQIERKRQERIEQFRRNESQKKVEMPRGKNSYSKKQEKDQFNQSDTPPPRSATIQRKTNSSINVPPQPHRNESTKIQREYKNMPVQPQQSQYSIRPNSSKQLPPNPSYYPDPQPRPPMHKQPRNFVNNQSEKPLSPFRTPKSMVPDNNRGKSIGKGQNPTIFTIQPQREKSSNKYEVKIQPKDRKNSFTRQSNKKQMINAITYVIFPGELNRKERERLIDIIEASQYQFFVFLFKEYSSRKMIRAIYIFDNQQTTLRKIYGEKSPSQITAEMVQEFYKYDNGSRQFKKLDSCRSFSFSISAIDLKK